MSVEVTSIPLWKQTLLDKKRRQNEESRRSEEEEVNKLSSLPNWKRDLLVKRHTQKNSLVFIGRDKHNVSIDQVDNSGCDNEQGTGQVSHNERDQTVPNNVVIIEPSDNDLSIVPKKNNDCKPSEGNPAENLLPVKQNPWLRTDVSRPNYGQKRHSDSNMLQNNNMIGNQVVNHTSWSGDIDIVKESKQDVEDNVFEEEVTYGKGFVHKLLRRFSRFSSPDDSDRGRKSSRSSSNRRSHSVENILEDSRSHSPISPRSYTHSYTESISPRSPTRSRSTESIASPRSLNDTNTQSDSKMGVTDKSGTGTSSYDSRDNSQDPSLLSPSWENISEAEDELPRKNTVASARNVFENITVPIKPEKKIKPLAPKPVRSPRNTVHSKIAVDNASSNGQSSKITNGPASVLSENSLVVPSIPSEVNKETNTNKNAAPSIVANKNIISKNTEIPVKTSQVESNVKTKKTEEIERVLENKTSSVEQSGGQSYYDLYVKKKSQSYDSVSNSSVTLTDTANGVLLNGDLGESSTEDSNQVVTTPTSPKSEPPSFKKRKAPPPPKPMVHQDRVKDSSEASSRIIVNCDSISNGVVKENGPSVKDSKPKSNSKPEITTTKPTVTKPSYNQTKPVTTQQKQTVVSNRTNEVTETKRPNLNLNLNQVNNKPEVVKASRGSSNDAYSVINNRANKKAKIVTPKSAGPGSLLIRPASNMIQAKNAQFAKLEFKYEDIRTGEFAPPKKKPAYYDSDSSDEDIPVTNIDDLDDAIEARNRDRNANIAKKGSKYEFVGAGVISGKSSLSKKRKEVKVILSCSCSCQVWMAIKCVICTCACNR